MTLDTRETRASASEIKFLLDEGQAQAILVWARANLQPAVATYVLRPGDTAWRALALDVLRIEEGVITEIVTFPGDLFPRFELPLTMDPRAEEGRPS